MVPSFPKGGPYGTRFAGGAEEFADDADGRVGLRQRRRGLGGRFSCDKVRLRLEDWETGMC